jgi:hypothetical protein
MRIFGLVVAGVLALVMLINASFMLVSPRAWFRLPVWIRFNGSLAETKYARGRRSLEVQLAGAAMLAIILWVVYDIFFSPR